MIPGHIFALLGFVVLNLIEAKLESYVIALKDPTRANYVELNRLEHKWSAIYYLVLVFFIALIMSLLLGGLHLRTFIMIAAAIVARRLFFDVSLKYFRRRPLAIIEGDGMVDTFVRGILGGRGGALEAGILLALFIGLVYLSF